MNKLIWIADDEPELLAYYKKIFEPKVTIDFFSSEKKQVSVDGFEVTLFPDGLPLLESFSLQAKAGKKIPLCILDMRMTTKSGLEIAESLRAIDREVCIVIVTAFSDYSVNEIRQRLKENIYYVKKPFNPEELLALTDSLIKSWNDRQLLLESRARLNSVIDSANDGIVTLQSDGSIVSFNPSAEKMFHTVSKEEKGKSISKFIQALDGNSLAKLHLSTSNGFEGKEFIGCNAKNESFPIEITLGEFRVGSLEYYTVVVRDITNRKLLEEALRESEKRWQFAIDGAGDGLWDWHVPSGQVFYSNQWKAMLGHSPQEIGNSLDEWEKRVHPEDKDNVDAIIKKHLSGTTDSYASEHRILCKDGTYKWILDRGKVISRTPTGEPERVIGTHTDISVRKKTEKMLAEIRKQEEAIASQIQQSLLLGTPPSNLKGIKISAKSIPSLAVDGDFYDFFAHNDLCVDILIGDVMGKGLAAAIIGAALKSSFLRALASFRHQEGEGALPSPRFILETVHNDVVPHLIRVESFVSLIYARFDLQNARLEIINCGHPYPIICRAEEGTCREIKHGGMPMGFTQAKNYEQRSYPLQSDDSFFFFSDGLTDSLVYRNEAESKRIIFDSLWENLHSEPEVQISEIQRHLDSNNPGRTFPDDVTCLGVRVFPHLDKMRVAQATAVFSNRLEELERMRSFMRKVYNDANHNIIEKNDFPLLELAATETLTNIIRHASSNIGLTDIELKIEILLDRVCLTFAHTGSDPIILPSNPHPNHTGMGLYVIANTVDEIQYTCDESGRNCIRLIKKGKLK